MVRGENLRQLLILGVHETLVYSLINSVVVNTSPPWDVHLAQGGFLIYK